jgi:hypothetical protein
MPISPMEDCSEQHWRDVKRIIEEAVVSIAEPQFSVIVVSDATDVGVIHKRIVENVYQCDIVVCDISCKNPNVMFELGMRIAFDKTAVIIKDDKTAFPFDTGTIETVQYPRSLRYSEVVSFKDQLASKVVHTYEASKKSNYASILKSFGAFEIATVEQKEVPAQALALREIQQTLRSLVARVNDIKAQQAPQELFFPVGSSMRSGMNTLQRAWWAEDEPKGITATFEPSHEPLPSLDGDGSSSLAFKP